MDADAWQRVGSRRPPTSRCRRTRRRGRQSQERVHDGELIETGRNKAAFRFACMVARWTDDPELVEQQTQAWVDRHCRNPEEVDVAKQVRGALKLSDTESLAQAVQSGSIPISNLATLLAQTEKFYRRYIVMTDAQFVAETLWTATRTRSMQRKPRRTSTQHPRPRRPARAACLDVAAQLVRAPLSTGGASEAALFRSIGADTTPTLLWDEVDTIFGPKSPENEGRRGNPEQRVTRNKPYLRCVGEGSKQKVEKFVVFCPKMLCGIGAVPDTIADRSLPIHLKRKTRSEKVERFRERKASARGCASTRAARGLGRRAHRTARRGPPGTPGGARRPSTGCRRAAAGD